MLYGTGPESTDSNADASFITYMCTTADATFITYIWETKFGG